MSPTKYCPALDKEIEKGKAFPTGECEEGDGYYCADYCPYTTDETEEGIRHYLERDRRT